MNTRKITAAILSLLVGVIVGIFLRPNETMVKRPTTASLPVATPVPDDTAPLRTRTAELETENRRLRDQIVSAKADRTRAAAPGSKAGQLLIRQIELNALQMRELGKPIKLDDNVIEFFGLTPEQRQAIEMSLNTTNDTMVQLEKSHAIVTQPKPGQVDIKIPAMQDAITQIRRQEESVIDGILGPDDGDLLNAKVNNAEANDLMQYSADIVITRKTNPNGTSYFEYQYSNFGQDSPTNPDGTAAMAVRSQSGTGVTYLNGLGASPRIEAIAEIVPAGFDTGSSSSSPH